MTYQHTYNRFMKDTKGHELQVLHDDGAYRHLLFKRPDMGVYHFNITTWPGFLAISGDMGCFVFSRIADMFEFFRNHGDEDQINPNHWGEKLEATPGQGHIEFSKNRFRSALRSDFNQWKIPHEKRNDVWAKIEEQILVHDVSTTSEAIRLTLEFHHPVYGFQDFWDHNLTEYTFRFIWCCFAIREVIQQYDSAKTQDVPA